jgi:hypothetical protein
VCAHSGNKDTLAFPRTIGVTSKEFLYELLGDNIGVELQKMKDATAQAYALLMEEGHGVMHVRRGFTVIGEPPSGAPRGGVPAPAATPAGGGGRIPMGRSEGSR